MKDTSGFVLGLLIAVAFSVALVANLVAAANI